MQRLRERIEQRESLADAHGVHDEKEFVYDHRGLPNASATVRVYDRTAAIIRTAANNLGFELAGLHLTLPVTSGGLHEPAIAKEIAALFAANRREVEEQLVKACANSGLERRCR
jgi:hypothetical protein